MVRAEILLVAVSAGLILVSGAAHADGAKKAGDFALVLQRSGGGLIDEKNEFSQYEFKLAKDGNWEFKSGRNPARKGKMVAKDVAKWVKSIQDGGFDKLKSNPALGAADEPFMDITLQVKGKNEQKKVALKEKLVGAIEKKLAEVVKAKK